MNINVILKIIYKNIKIAFKKHFNLISCLMFKKYFILHIVYIIFSKLAIIYTLIYLVITGSFGIEL